MRFESTFKVPPTFLARLSIITYCQAFIITSVHDNHSAFSLQKEIIEEKPAISTKVPPIFLAILALVDIAMVRPSRTNPSTEGANLPPTCLLCQMEIPSTFDRGIAGSPESDQLLKDRQPWKSYWRSSHKHVMVPSARVEEADFGDLPRLWSCFCRAIIKESDTKYRITGINMVQEEYSRPYNFPTDPNIARIGGRRNGRCDPQIFTSCMAARPGRQPSKYKGMTLGFIIHVHCWVLFGRTIKTPLTEINLERFIKALRSNWRKSKLKDLVDYTFCQTIRAPSQVLLEFEHGCDIYQNPVIVPVLQKVITNALNRHDYTTPSEACFNRLPAELTHLISEWVLPIEYTSNDVRNMRYMLLAFGWDIPDWFWRRRLADDLFFELDISRKSSFPPPSWMNLQMMRLDVMRLTFNETWYPHSGLANRKRIYKNIVAIKKGLGID